MSGLEGAFGGLLLIAAVALYWASAVNARDRARQHARRFCERQGWQLLDQTVALGSIRPARTDQGLRWQRIYRFDFSPDGGQRRGGGLTMIGPRMVEIWGELEDGGRLIG